MQCCSKYFNTIAKLYEVSHKNNKTYSLLWLLAHFRNIVVLNTEMLCFYSTFPSVSQNSSKTLETDSFHFLSEIKQNGGSKDVFMVITKLIGPGSIRFSKNCHLISSGLFNYVRTKGFY